jgi:hypothetical protein
MKTIKKKAFTCECGGFSTLHNKSRHLKSKFHLQYMERVMSSTDSTIPVVPPITDTQLVRGICYIPLEQFENIKQQVDVNEDHFYFSNHYDFMHHQQFEHQLLTYNCFRITTSAIIGSAVRLGRYPLTSFDIIRSNL